MILYRVRMIRHNKTLYELSSLWEEVLPKLYGIPFFNYVQTNRFLNFADNKSMVEVAKIRIIKIAQTL